ncbi:hypothetical protein Lal_00048477 [Lupinus albus]|nr:hypothetical protein Lal_00048477 [Lupinus albus]
MLDLYHELMLTYIKFQCYLYRFTFSLYIHPYPSQCLELNLNLSQKLYAVICLRL